MKKLYVFMSVSLLISGLPLCTALSTSINQINENQLLTFDNVQPEWATGYFVGLIGITSDFGHPGPYGGYIVGYYEKDDFKGKFIGAIGKKDTSEILGFIGGYLGGPFLLGMIGNTSSNKITPVVGIGLNNETHVYYRIMGLIGPTFYFAGKYQLL
jgi:hypothetical protein